MTNGSSDGLSQLTEIMRDERVYDDERVTRAPVDPVTRRKRRRTGLIVGGIASVFVLIFAGSYVGYALNAPVGAATSTTTPPFVPTGPVAEVELSPEGASAIRIEGADEYFAAATTGFDTSNGGTGPRPIASITKLITAMVILDAKPLKNPDSAGPTITFSKADHDLYDTYYVLGATIASMPAGSSMSEHDALEMLLVPSASNYAEAVARWAFGSQAGFVAAAKAWLADHKLKHTIVVEPTGLDARNVSTTGDLLRLGALAMADPVIAQIVGMPRLDVPGLDPMRNTNDTLGTGGIDGIKTGTLEASGSNLLFHADLEVGLPDPLSVTGVVLGGFSHESVNADATVMLQSIANGFHAVQLAKRGDEVGTYTTAWGESATMILDSDAAIYTWSDTPITAELQTIDLTTGADGEEVGSVTWDAGPNTVTVPVVLKGSISPPDEWWRLTHPFELG